MPIPKSHFYVRTRQDADERNPGRHPLIGVKIAGSYAYIAACSSKDRFSKDIACKILNGRQAAGCGVAIGNGDTIQSILDRAGVPRKILRDADLDRASIAYERAIEA